ncbi:MAG: hypothetical protein P1V51_04670, partial [Deltaproteobacteria bacterium]|nr:hypothetical protein [Deltaproteobacteria bacterium]
MSRARRHRRVLVLGPGRLALLLCAALLSGCSWAFVPRSPERYEQQGMPCESSYSWPIADAGMAGIVVPGATVGTIYALQQSCRDTGDCQTQTITSVVAGVVGIIAVFFYIGAHHDGMQRVTKCRQANIRYRFANRPPRVTPPAPAPGALPPVEPATAAPAVA